MQLQSRAKIFETFFLLPLPPQNNVVVSIPATQFAEKMSEKMAKEEGRRACLYKVDVYMNGCVKMKRLCIKHVCLIIFARECRLVTYQLFNMC